MGSSTILRKQALVKAVAVALLVGTGNVAVAQSAPAADTAAAAAVQFDIPAQSLASALEAFAEQSGLQVVYAGGAGSGVQSGVVNGQMGAATALQQLLAPTAYAHEFINAKTVAIRPRSSAGDVVERDGGAAETLETINVTGTYLKNIDPASPLIVIDSQLIESRGYASIEDVLRNLPQNFSNRTSASRALGEK